MSAVTISARNHPDLKAKAYVWSFPGGPIHIHFNLDVVRRMEEILKPAAQVGSVSRCGILLGLNRPGLPEITDFLPLHTPDITELQTALTRLKSSDDRPFPIGYYRTHNEDRLRLSPDDLSLARTFFSDPNCVFLLIRRLDVFLPTSAGFFFWDRGQMNGDFCFLEFPFESSLLATAEERKRTSERKSASIVAPAIAAPSSVPQAREVGQRALSKAKNRRLRSVLQVALAAMVIAVVGCAVGVVLSQKIVWITGDKPNTIRLVLNVKHQGTDLALTWNHDSPLVKAADTGRLTFYDGGSAREFPLDRAHLLSGSVLYTPVSDQVRVQLDLITRDKTTTSESVMVVLRPQTTSAAEAPPLVSSPPVASASTQTVSQPKPVVIRSTRTFQPPKDEAGTQPLPAADIQLSPPAMTNILMSPPLAMRLPSPMTQSVMGPKPPVSPPTSGNQPQSLSLSQNRPAIAAKTSDYIAAVPLSRATPQALTAAQRSLLSRVAVSADIMVSIDEFGKVRKAESLSHASPVLVTAALSAARLWTFRPAQQGGRNVPSQIVLRFKFDPRKQ